MSPGSFSVVRRATDKLDLELAGDLTEADVGACETELRALLSATKQGALKALFDLRGIEGYTLAARAALVSLQRFIDTKANQTAFVASSAVSRGLALWVMHMTEQPSIKSFASREDAVAWLSGDVGPTTGVRPVMRAGSRARARDKKIAG